MRKIKFLFLYFLAVLISFSASSCSHAPEIPNTEKIISALCDAEINMPSGAVYSSDVEPQSPNYLNDSLLCAYFGEPNIQKYKKDWVSYSIFINHGTHVCEFAAIYCSTPESLIDTARLLLSRIDSIKKSSKGKFNDYLDQAQIVSLNNYAILIISNDVKQARKIIEKLI